MHELLFLAVESSIPPDHIAARLAVPIGFLFFGGSIYLLLWSNYGAKKAVGIYGTAFFGFTLLLGVFWWFGAPGTPQNLGVTFLPGQETDHYAPGWYGFEPGSERAELFDADESPQEFETAPAYLGMEDADPEQLEEDPGASELVGNLNSAVDVMSNQVLPIDDNGVPQLGQQRRSALEEEVAELQPDEAAMRASPFFTAEPVDDPRVTDDDGTMVATAEFQLYANFLDADEIPLDPIPVGETQRWFAFFDPGGEWVPSALWSGASLAGFLLSLFWLDTLEMRDKRRRETEVEEPEDLAVPISQ